MSCSCAPSLVKLRDQLNAAYPHRDKASDGCCADANHPSYSDHSPTNGYAHALDIDEGIGEGVAPLQAWIPSLLADSRTKYVIYEKWIHYPDGTSKVYNGENAHDKHLHLSIKLSATKDTRPWPMPPTSQPTEEDMTPASATRPGIDRIDFFLVGKDNAVWWLTSAGATRTNWRSLGGQAKSGVSASWRGNQLVVSVKGGDDALWHNYSNDEGASWAGWSSLGGKIA